MLSEVFAKQVWPWWYLDGAHSLSAEAFGELLALILLCVFLVLCGKQLTEHLPGDGSFNSLLLVKKRKTFSLHKINKNYMQENLRVSSNDLSLSK